MGKLVLTPLSTPKVDIGTISFDNRLSPIKQISVMSDTDFEQFTSEWLYGCKKDEYQNIVNIGGAGDKGRDVIAYHLNGDVDYYQCKHYDNALSPSQVYVEIGKLCYYTFDKQIPIPINYFFIASNGIGPSLQDLIDNPQMINSELIKNWDTYCKAKITKTKQVPLDLSLVEYIKKFNFSIMQHYPIQRVIDEHLTTKYGYFRFGGQKVERPNPLGVPPKFEDFELTYIKELYCVYSETIGKAISTIDELKHFAQYLNHFQNQRKSFFAAETIRRFVRDTFSDNDEFEILKEEVYEGIVDICTQNYANGYDRLSSTLQAATQISTGKSLLDSKLHYVGNSERKGICHMLVNDDKIRWVTDDE